MKVNFMSGISARVKRWIGLMFVFTVTGSLVTLTAPSASAASPTIYPMVACIPMNNLFAGPLKPLLSKVFGAFGGLVPALASGLIILAIVWGLIKVFNKEDVSGIFKAIIAIPGVVLGGIVVLILFNSIIVLANSQCKVTPF